MQNAGRTRNVKKEKNPFDWTMIFVGMKNLINTVLYRGFSGKAAVVVKDAPFKLPNLFIHERIFARVCLFYHILSVFLSVLLQS